MNAQEPKRDPGKKKRRPTGDKAFKVLRWIPVVAALTRTLKDWLSS